MFDVRLIPSSLLNVEYEYVTHLVFVSLPLSLSLLLSNHLLPLLLLHHSPLSLLIIILRSSVWSVTITTVITIVVTTLAKEIIESSPFLGWLFGG